MTIQTPTEQQPISQDINDYVSLYDLVLYARACHIDNGNGKWYFTNRKDIYPRRTEFGTPNDLYVNEYEKVGRLENRYRTSLYQCKYFSMGIESLLKGIKESGQFINKYIYKTGLRSKIIKQDENLSVLLSDIQNDCSYFSSQQYIDDCVNSIESDTEEGVEVDSAKYPLIPYFSDLPNCYISIKQAIEVFSYPDYQKMNMSVLNSQAKKINDNNNKDKEQQINDPESQLEQLKAELKAKDEEMETLKQGYEAELKAKDEKIKYLERENKKTSKPQELNPRKEESYKRIILGLLERLNPEKGNIVPIVKTIGNINENNIIRINVADLGRKLNKTLNNLIEEEIKNKDNPKVTDRGATYRKILAENVARNIELIDN